MDHVTSLAKGLEIAQGIVRRIVVQMGGGENHLGAQFVIGFWGKGHLPPDFPALAITPDLLPDVPPPPVTHVANDLAMRPAALFTASPGSLEPHILADLWPVDRIEPAMLRSDRHQAASFGWLALFRACGK